MRETMATQWDPWICAEGAGQLMLVSSLTAGESIRKEDLSSRQIFTASSCPLFRHRCPPVPHAAEKRLYCLELLLQFELAASWPPSLGATLTAAEWEHNSWSHQLEAAGPRICLDLTLLWMKLRGHKGCTLDGFIRSQLFGHLKLRWPEWGSLYFWMQISVQIIYIVLLAHLKNL